MQRDLKLIEDAGVQIVGISYDEPKVLKTASERMKITFPLLSDPESKTIDAYHIRNEAAKGKAEGVPHPGTFVLDQEGVIRAKLFLEGYSRTAHDGSTYHGGEGRQMTPCPPNDRRRTMRKLALTFAACGMLLGSTSRAGAAPYAPKVGQRHPDFTLPTIGDRTPVSLSNFRGKKVLLIQFASW